MFWGTGPALGFLTFIGYAVFVIGSAIVWRDRADVSVWIHDEVGAARRRFSRYTVNRPVLRHPRRVTLQSRARQLSALPAPHSSEPYQWRRGAGFSRITPGSARFFYLIPIR
jgi:hypothetical protein